MKYLLYLVLIGIFFDCSSSNKKEPKDSEEPTQVDMYPDSLFYIEKATEFNVQVINKVLDEKSIPLTEVNDKLKGQLSKCSDSGSEILGAQYYTSFGRFGDHSAIVLFLSTMESQSFIVATISSDSNVLSCLQLTEDRCDLVDQDDEKEEVWCNIKSANMIESNKLQIIQENIFEMHYANRMEVKKDSIVLTYQITDKGLLSMIQSDSIRLEF